MKTVVVNFTCLAAKVQIREVAASDFGVGGRNVQRENRERRLEGIRQKAVTASNVEHFDVGLVHICNITKSLFNYMRTSFILQPGFEIGKISFSISDKKNSDFCLPISNPYYSMMYTQAVFGREIFSQGEIQGQFWTIGIFPQTSVGSRFNFKLEQ